MASDEQIFVRTSRGIVDIRQVSYILEVEIDSPAFGEKRIKRIIRVFLRGNGSPYLSLEDKEAEAFLDFLPIYNDISGLNLS